MAKTKTKSKVTEVREQATDAVTKSVEQLRTSLLAALGAGDLATEAARDFLNKAKDNATKRTETVRGAVDELPADLKELREKADPAELRKLVDEYTEAAQKLYRKLTDRGEDRLEKLRTEPRVKKAIDQLEEALKNAQTRVEGVTTDARHVADDVIAKVTRRTKETGEKVADKIEETGDEVAGEVRETTRKVASKTSTTARKTTTPRKTSTAKTTK